MHPFERICAAGLLALFSFSALAAADQPESKTKPTPPSQASKPNTNPQAAPKSNSKPEEQQKAQKPAATPKHNSPWRPGGAQ